MRIRGEAQVENEVYQAFAEYLPEDQDLITYSKLPRRYHSRLSTDTHFIKITNEKNQKHEILREARMLQLLQRKLHYHIPNPLKIIDQEVFPYAGFAYKKIGGAVGHLEDSFRKDRKQLVAELSTLWYHLQSLSDDKKVVDELETYAPAVQEIRQNIDDKTLWKHFNKSEIDIIREFSNIAVEILPEPVEMKFLHGDLWLGNLLFSEKRKIIAILDFARCWYGDPLADLAKLAYADADLAGEILIHHSNHYEEFPIDKAMLRVLLHRGVYILLALLEQDINPSILQKVKWHIIDPIDRIRQLHTDTKIDQ